MKLTPEIVEKIARLVKLQLTDEEKQSYATQLSQILKYIEKLNELNTESVAPLVNALEKDFALPLREDVVEKLDGQILESAPEQIYQNFKVPQVL